MCTGATRGNEMPRPKKFHGSGTNRGVLISDEVWENVRAIARRDYCTPSDIVRIALDSYILTFAPDLLSPDDPKNWGDEEWAAHFIKHDKLLGYPVDLDCKACQTKYPSRSERLRANMGEYARPKDFIDPRLKREDQKRTRRPLKFFSAYDTRDWNVKDDSDIKVLERHYEEHPDHFVIEGKRRDIDHAGHAHECEVCAEVDYIVQLTLSDPSGINRDI
jgi:hypothetical protein